MHDEQAMILAHKAGRAFAQNINASLGNAYDRALESYPTKDEREAFVAGYLGELKRFGVERSLT